MEAERPLFLRPIEVSKLLQVSRSKVYELIAAGQIPARKIGASLRIPRAALEAMAAETVAADRPAEE